MTEPTPIRTVFAGRESGVPTIITPDGFSGFTTNDPADKFFVPPEGRFTESDFMDNPTAEKIADILMGKCREFSHLTENQANILYLWKAKGGKSGGKPTLGKTTKASGLVQYYSRADFILWFAADHCREMAITNYQMEALIYHELCHCDFVEELDKDGEPTGEFSWALRAHDVAIFHNEVARYGAWETSLQQNRQSWEQLALKEKSS